MDLYTTGAYRINNPDWHLQDAPYKARCISKLLKEEQVVFSSCVDVGCGVGGVISVLAQHFDAEFTGFDISPSAIDEAKNRFDGHRFRFVQGDVLEADTTWDLVLCLDVFEHVLDYLRFLTKLKRIGGRFVFHIPLEMNMVHLLTDRQVHKRKIGGHLHFFSRATALQALEDSGYQIQAERLTYGGLFQPHSFRSLGKLLLKIPRAIITAVSARLSAKLLGGASLLVLAEPADRAGFED